MRRVAREEAPPHAKAVGHLRGHAPRAHRGDGNGHVVAPDGHLDALGDHLGGDVFDLLVGRCDGRVKHPPALDVVRDEHAARTLRREDEVELAPRAHHAAQVGLNVRVDEVAELLGPHHLYAQGGARAAPGAVGAEHVAALDARLVAGAAVGHAAHHAVGGVRERLPLVAVAQLGVRGLADPREEELLELHLREVEVRLRGREVRAVLLRAASRGEVDAPELLLERAAEEHARGVVVRRCGVGHGAHLATGADVTASSSIVQRVDDKWPPGRRAQAFFLRVPSFAFMRASSATRAFVAAHPQMGHCVRSWRSAWQCERPK